MNITYKHVEYRVCYRFPWEFFFRPWKLRKAIQIWGCFCWKNDMKDLWRDKGIRFLGFEFMKRTYA